MEDSTINVLVVKVGTSTLMMKDDNGEEQLDHSSFTRIGQQVTDLQGDGLGVVLISSGAITAGMVATGQASRPNKFTEMTELQRLASIGWRNVLNAWSDALADINVGSLLLTKHELGLPSEREEVLRVTHALLSHGDVVVANENDAIVHDEIAFGDNDTLAASFAAQLARSALFGTVRLVLLSDVAGVYADLEDESSLIQTIDDVKQYREAAIGVSSVTGTGGMVTKFDAANIAKAHGVEMWIANGREEHVIQRVLNGEIGTHFV